MKRLLVRDWCRYTWSPLLVLTVAGGAALWVPAEDVEAGAIFIKEGIETVGDLQGGSSDLILWVRGLQVPGPPQPGDHPEPDQLQILGFNWGDELPGILRPAATGGGAGGGGGGSTTAHDFHFFRHVDLASPLLMEACARGEHFRDVVLFAHLNSPGSQHFDYLEITLMETSCTSYALGGAADLFWPREHVTFSFREIEYVFRDEEIGLETRGRYNVQTGR